ncbi:MAG: AAA family ATPase, partial [Clostridia bacterium]|nr:AAA family ATPase [Clostridia bacterium]
MKIRNITINSFGKLNNYSLDLRDGVNVVYGPNEYGKTTIMEFIKIMFYSKNEKSAT